MFYAANNSYSTPTSIGFSNTWYVIAFATRKDRDEYVRNDEGLASRAITKREISKYCQDKPKPFSGEYMAIVDEFKFISDREPPKGYVGFVEVVNPYERFLSPQRLYK